MNTEKTHPGPSYRYLIRVGDDQMKFNRVSGLELSVETIEYKDGTGGVYRMPGQNTELNISLKDGIMMNQGQLNDWFSSIQHNQVKKKDISISLNNEADGELLVTWNVTNAFPTKLTAPSFDATNNNTYIGELCLLAESLTITFH